MSLDPTPYGTGSDLPSDRTTSLTAAGRTLPRFARVLHFSPDDAVADAVPLEWTKGDLILGIYEVIGVLGQGGMGTVYKVRHQGWDVDLAVKCPNREIFNRPGGTHDFVREAENWVQLGLHPNIVSCYYVRKLGGIPRVFAEYVPGGDLSTWIHSGKLYEGGDHKSLKRILDIAIQFAWGLHHAHLQGFIHQDVKPANVMVTRDGAVKVTDFGLSRACFSLEDPDESTRGMTCTPAYASPEQVERPDLTYHTDIWSWGLSVLEMFTQNRPSWGPLAEVILESSLQAPHDAARPDIPKEVGEILKACFQKSPEQRPQSMDHVAHWLVELYEHYIGEPYTREKPQGAALLADGLNNRAVSLMDLGRYPEAMDLLDHALGADPNHMHASFNRALLHWRSGRMTDEAVLNLVRDLQTGHGRGWMLNYLTGCVHMERGDEGAARKHLQEAWAGVGSDTAGQALVQRSMEALGAGYQEVGRLRGHVEGITAVALPPGGEWLVSASKDRTIRLWNPRDGTCRGAMRNHRGIVTALAISPDGRFVASAADNGTLYFWQAQTGSIQARMEGHQGAIRGLSLAIEGRLVLSAGDDGTVRAWESVSGRNLRVLLGHRAPVRCVAVNEDGGRALSGSEDGVLCLWNVTQGVIWAPWAGHEGPVSAVAITSDGRLGLSAGEDGVLRLWDLMGPSCLAVFSGHQGRVRSLVMSPEGTSAVSSGDDGTVRVWEVATGKVVRTLHADNSWIYAVAMATGSGLFAAGTADHQIYVWQMPPELKETQPLVVQPRTSEEMLVMNSGVSTLLQNARASLHQGQYQVALDSLRRAREVPGYERAPDCMALWAEAASVMQRGPLRAAWMERTLQERGGRIGFVDMTADGRVAVTGTEDGQLAMWDLATGQAQTLPTVDGSLTALALAGRGRWMAVANKAGLLEVRDILDGGAIPFGGHRNVVTCVA
ncbi:MAG: protein kinase domain-containing protein, partial [Candidatus Xenobia bacterium]